MNPQIKKFIVTPCNISIWINDKTLAKTADNERYKNSIILVLEKGCLKFNGIL